MVKREWRAGQGRGVAKREWREGERRGVHDAHALRAPTSVES